METLFAAHISLNSMERFHEMPFRGFYTALRMSWLELELGRICPFLAWRNFVGILLREMALRQLPTDGLMDDFVNQDGCLSCLFMKVPAQDLADIADVDDCLEVLSLFISRMTLLVRTGRKAMVVAEMTPAEGFSEATLDSLMNKYVEQPAYKSAPDHLCDEGRTVCAFKTTLFGVTYHIRCRNKLGPLLFAENLLGVLESALALIKWENLAFIVDEVKIFIDETDTGESPPKIEFEHFASGREQRLVWKSGMLEWMRQNIVPFRSFLQLFLLNTLVATTIDPRKDLERELDNLHREKALERALMTSPTSVAIIDLLPKDSYDLNNWINNSPPSSI